MGRIRNPDLAITFANGINPYANGTLIAERSVFPVECLISTHHGLFGHGAFYVNHAIKVHGVWAVAI